MPRNRPMLTDGQWAKIEPLLPQLRAGQREGGPGRIAGVCWRGFYGSPAMGRAGRICLGLPVPCWRGRESVPISVHPHAPATSALLRWSAA